MATASATTVRAATAAHRQARAGPPARRPSVGATPTGPVGRGRWSGWWRRPSVWSAPRSGRPARPPVSACPPSATTDCGVSSSRTWVPVAPASMLPSSGIWLEPPTRWIASRSSGVNPQPVATSTSSSTARARSARTRRSNSARVSSLSAIPSGNAISACGWRESTSLAARTSSRKRSSAAIWLGRNRCWSSSRPARVGSSPEIQSTIRWSRSSPPRSGSPAQPATVSPPGSRRTTAASQVPPPKSSTPSAAPTGKSCCPANQAAAATGSDMVDSRGARPCAAASSAPIRVEPQFAGWVSTSSCTGEPAVPDASATTRASTARTSAVVGTTASPSSTSGSATRDFGRGSSRAGSVRASRSASVPTTASPRPVQNTADGNHG